MYFKDPQKKSPFESFSRYQLLQKERDLIVLRVVISDAELWRSERPILEKKLQATLGAKTDILIQEEDELPPSPSGKHHFVWSEVE
jgi:hypothetical protein